ncbi:ParB/RepB/Spo0J family partition protein (plasmid) [Bradyrhizobium barranii subsp. apii]|uniref:ParB/RepB/Spo0J family partition protein n=1 Tax=Bradyrhizobium barranii TaxID=2992140 RepID=UPI001CD7335B|nr:ParB/RepB/Spo0J family partition protein [Bradyrhizobium barranii]UPU01427.1 ParB/RepB/Spo0J family partition protein [Bradyrhizobium barranii subsp. apii]
MALDLSFKQLIDAAEDGVAATGQPTSISIDRIDEDPGQPRRSFDEQKLDELAESVLQHGVLQPIVVRQGTDEGRYVIVMGARRYRAAKRAGLRDIPAFIHAAGSADRYVQMIENIQRDDLNAPEIAAFVADRLEQGDNQADISRKLGKPRDWVSRYASVQSMPEFLRSKLAGSSIRAVYVSVPKHVESNESVVIQGERPDSMGTRRQCGLPRTVHATTAAACAIRAT